MLKNINICLNFLKEHESTNLLPGGLWKFVKGVRFVKLMPYDLVYAKFEV